jgi:hypothetical protein
MVQTSPAFRDRLPPAPSTFKLPNKMLAQIPTPPPTSSPETWAAILTTIAGAAGLLLKNRFKRKQPPATKTAHQDLNAIRDRVTAGYLALGEKIDANQKDILTAITQHATLVEERLDRLELAVARLDERTKKTPTSDL